VLKMIEAVDKGERWAIELQFEMTGRHRRGQEGQSPTELFAAMFQILDESGVPEQILQQVGRRFRELANPGSAASRAAGSILAPTGQAAPVITSLEE